MHPSLQYINSQLSIYAGDIIVYLCHSCKYEEVKLEADVENDL